MVKERIEKALAAASQWAQREGVVAVGQGESEGRPCIIVHISNEEARSGIPATFMGFPVLVTLGDEIRAQAPGSVEKS